MTMTTKDLSYQVKLAIYDRAKAQINAAGSWRPEPEGRVEVVRNVIESQYSLAIDGRAGVGHFGIENAVEIAILAQNKLTRLELRKTEDP